MSHTDAQNMSHTDAQNMSHTYVSGFWMMLVIGQMIQMMILIIMSTARKLVKNNPENVSV